MLVPFPLSATIQNCPKTKPKTKEALSLDINITNSNKNFIEIENEYKQSISYINEHVKTIADFTKQKYIYETDIEKLENWFRTNKNYTEIIPNIPLIDRKSTRLNSSHIKKTSMPTSA